VACLAAAVEVSVGGVAAEELLLSFLPLFAAEGRPINSASILPGLLRDFGDVTDVLAAIAPRPVLVAAGVGESSGSHRSLKTAEGRFTADARLLTDWLRE
jgi:hypothetical protein